MKRNVIFTIVSILGILFGLAMLIIPEIFMKSYGVTLDAHTTFVTRYYGLTMFSLGIIIWLIRNVDSVTKAFRAVMIGGFLFGLLGVIVSIWNVIAVPVTTMHWTNLIVYALVAIGFGYLLLKKTE